jgi:hypothetical protein
MASEHLEETVEPMPRGPKPQELDPNAPIGGGLGTVLVNADPGDEQDADIIAP